MPKKNGREYDGIYFTPGDEENELMISYWNFKDEDMASAKLIDNTEIGDMYYVAFFKRNEKGEPTFDDSFEAIFADPSIYINNLAGAGVYGCVVKKTEKSSEWFDDYLQRTIGHVRIKELIGSLKSILETK
jgi:hypothetical protein